MNWKIIVQLSIFGLIMAFGTVSLIPQKIEPVFWLVIFVFCAFVIAKVCTGKYFWHGFLVSMFNCIWIVAVHIFYYKNYTANHPDMVSMTEHLPASLAIHPRLSMVISGQFLGSYLALFWGFSLL